MNFQPTIDFTPVFTKVAGKFIIRINFRVNYGFFYFRPMITILGFHKWAGTVIWLNVLRCWDKTEEHFQKLLVLYQCPKLVGEPKNP